MHTLIVLGLLTIGLTLCDGRKGEEICIYRYADGRKADCGGFVGKQCPSTTDRCVYLPNADYGYCCLGCSGKCTRRGGCRYGETCNYPEGRSSRKGVCCPARRG